MAERNYVVEMSSQELELKYESLTISDDFIFGKVMQEKENCIGMLERLTGNLISDDIVINNQHTLKVAVDGKSVRYDIYVEDKSCAMYDAEMQNSDNQVVLPKRARFYQGLMDLNYLEVGNEYRSLVDSYVIFICTFDPFGRKFCCYEFENNCAGYDEITGISLGDGRKIYIYNTKGTVINVDNDTLKFLKFIDEGVPLDDYTKRLQSSVAMARLNKEWKVEYMKTYLHDSDVRWEGIEIGISYGKDMHLIDLICRKLRKGKTPEIITEELEEQLDNVQLICKIADEFAPEYDVEKVYRVFADRKS